MGQLETMMLEFEPDRRAVAGWPGVLGLWASCCCGENVTDAMVDAIRPRSTRLEIQATRILSRPPLLNTTSYQKLLQPGPPRAHIPISYTHHGESSIPTRSDSSRAKRSTRERLVRKGTHCFLLIAG